MNPERISISSKILLVLVIFMLTKVQLKAQTTDSGSIKGVVNDVQKSAVPNAVIILKTTKDSGIYRTALSNEKGEFTFNSLKPGDYFLEIALVGFEKLKTPNLPVNDVNTTIDLGILTLKTAAKTLAGVTIKADVPLIERKIDKTVVNVAQSITSEGSTVLEMMQKLPGVQMTPDGQITLNGKPGVNVLIDGKTTYLSAEDLANLLNGMPASSVQQIEIMSNPSSKYDAARTSGIINIVKKKNNKDGLNGSINGSFVRGYYGKYSGGLTLSYKNEHYNLFFNDTYNYNKDFSSRTVISDISDISNKLLAEQRSINDGMGTGRSYRPTVGLDIYLSKKTTLTLTGTAGLGSSNSQLLSGMDVLDSARSKVNHIGFISKLKDNPFNYTAGVQLVHQLDTMGRSFNIDADHSEYSNFPVQSNFSSLGDAQNNFISETDNLLLQHRQLDIYGVKADYVQPLKDNGIFEAGIKSSYVKANNDDTYYDVPGGLIDLKQSNYSVNSENINAAYVNLNTGYQKLTLQAGLRAEQTVTKGRQRLTDESVDQNYFQLFPTLFLAYKLDDQNSFTIRTGRRIERADYHELVPFRRPQTATLFFQGNPDLRPQTSWHAEFTWSYQGSFFVTLNYDICHDYIRTFPFLDSNKTTITRRPINIQGAHIWDVDFAYTKKLTSWWSTDNTLSVYQNAFNGQAYGLSLNNPGLASIDLSANNSFQIGNALSAECDFEYDSKRQFATSTFGAYSVLSFGLKRQVIGNKGSVSINANNVLQSEGRYGIDRTVGLYQYSNFRDYSRSFSLNFTYRFGSGKGSKVKIDSGSADEQKRAGN
jgi:Outer membrane protein beta-barrel family/Carboxypeptidase regulatory-like domain